MIPLPDYKTLAGAAGSLGRKVAWIVEAEQLISDTVEAIAEEVSPIEPTLAEISAKIDAIPGQFPDASASITGLSQAMNVNSGKVDSMRDDLQTFIANFGDIRTDVNAINNAQQAFELILFQSFSLWTTYPFSAEGRAAVEADILSGLVTGDIDSPILYKQGIGVGSFPVLNPLFFTFQSPSGDQTFNLIPVLLEMYFRGYRP